MFGGLSFMVDDSMVVAADRHGDLLVRIDPARDDELVDGPRHRRAARLLDAGRARAPSHRGEGPARTEDQVAAEGLGVVVTHGNAPSHSLA
jgi:hypothetical protein